MRILSFDHGTSTGWSYFEDGKLIDSGIIKLTCITKLDEAYNKYEPLFYKYKPNVVVLEKVNVGGIKFGANNVIKLAQLQAVLRLLCYSNNIELCEVNPTSMKKLLTGNGRADKEIIAQKTAELLDINYYDIVQCIPYKNKNGIKAKIYDKSDAISLGLYYLKINE